jgi:PAS domain S-box-containing protein
MTTGKPGLSGYGVALLAIVAAVADIILTPGAAPVATFVLAVIVGTWFGGPRAGIFTTAVSVPILAYLLMPHPSLNYGVAVATRIVYFVAIAAFIIWIVASDRRAAQSLRADIAKRQALESELRLVIDTIPAMAWTLLPDGRLDFLNRRWLEYTGLSLEQALSGANDTVHPDDLPRVMKRWREMETVSRGYEQELRLRRVDGEHRWFLVRTVPLLDEKGAVLRWYGTSTDIEDVKRAEQALRDSAAGMQQLSRRLLEVQEAERRHLARELHDEFGQLLAAVTLHLHAAQREKNEAARSHLDESMRLLQRAGSRVRSLALELRPTMLETAGLDAALRWLAEQHLEQTGMEVSVAGRVEGVSGDRAIACFRVAQEALTNVMRHARARNVWIEVKQTAQELQLAVRDDGVGFDPDQALDRTAGMRLGLLGMKERVEIFGGSLEIESAPGSGTRIRVSLPVTAAAPAEAAT